MRLGAEAETFIAENVRQAVSSRDPAVYKTKSSAQDAHEAIRPSNVNLDPESIKSSLTTEQYKLYRLVWSRFVASQMSNALYDTLSIDTVSAGHIFRANHQSLKFQRTLCRLRRGQERRNRGKADPAAQS